MARGAVVRGQIADQLDDVVGEMVGIEIPVPPQRPGGGRVGARGASETEIDAAGVERLERAELLGDDERRMVGEHDAAGADADHRGGVGQVGDEHRRRGAGDRGHAVMLGHPEAAVAESLGETCASCVVSAKSTCRGRTGRHRGQVENRKGHHEWCNGCAPWSIPVLAPLAQTGRPWYARFAPYSLQTTSLQLDSLPAVRGKIAGTRVRLGPRRTVVIGALAPSHFWF